MVRRLLSVAGMALALAVVLAACGSTDEREPEATVTRIPDAANAPVLTPTAGGSPAVDGSPVPFASPTSALSPVADGTVAGTVSGAEALEVGSYDIYFEPNAFTIPADTDVTISLPNHGAAPHNFSIDELEISADLAPGETKEVVINAPAGTYEYYCNVPGHREAGMVGTLTVQ